MEDSQDVAIPELLRNSVIVNVVQTRGMALRKINHFCGVILGSSVGQLEGQLGPLLLSCWRRMALYKPSRLCKMILQGSLGSMRYFFFCRNFGTWFGLFSQAFHVHNVMNAWNHRNMGKQLRNKTLRFPSPKLAKDRRVVGQRPSEFVRVSWASSISL